MVSRCPGSENSKAILVCLTATIRHKFYIIAWLWEWSSMFPALKQLLITKPFSCLNPIGTFHRDNCIDSYSTKCVMDML